MLQFQISTAASPSNWRIDRGRWACGADWVAPLTSPALESALLACRREVSVVVRERLVGRPKLPVTALAGGPVATLDPEQVSEIVAATRDWPADFLMLRIRGAEVVLEAGALGTAPVYLAAGTALVGSWDLAELRGVCRGTDDVDPETVSQFLLRRPRYSTRTLLRGVRLLTERCTARWDRRQGLRMELPAPAVHHLPRQVRDGAAVIEAYGSLLDTAVQRRAVDPADVVVELSGGVDSATVGLSAAAAAAPGAVRSYGMLIGGRSRSQQIARRALLVELAGLRDQIVDAMRWPPLGPHEQGRVNPWEEPYQLALEAAIASTPAPVVLTGIGGDELLSLRPEERLPTAEIGDRAGPVFLSAAVLERGAMRGPRPGDAPASVLPETVLLAQLVRAPIFLRAGRWPVGPLCDPDLVRFGQWLPREWRAGKQIARGWLRARGVPPEVVWPRLRENFAEVMQLGLRTHGLAHLQGMLSTGSLLVDCGYVDPDRLRAALGEAERAVARGEPIDIDLYEVVVLDRCLSELLG